MRRDNPEARGGFAPPGVKKPISRMGNVHLNTVERLAVLEAMDHYIEALRAAGKDSDAVFLKPLRQRFIPEIKKAG